jgi:hypothetical protein
MQSSTGWPLFQAWSGGCQCESSFDASKPEKCETPPLTTRDGSTAPGQVNAFTEAECDYH